MLNQPRRAVRPALACAGGVAAALLAAACGAAPGAASPPGGSARFGAAFPVGPRWVSGDGTAYATVLTVHYGSGSRTFDLAPRPGLVLWAGCLADASAGPGTGPPTARVTSPALGLDWNVRCDGSSDPAGLEFRPVRPVAGQAVALRVIAPAAVRWELRVDAPAAR